MSLKMKLFDKSLVRADVKRLWVSSFIYGILIFLSAFFPLYGSDRYIYFPVNAVGANIFGVIYSGIIGFTLFSYLNSAGSAAFYHGLPLTRKTIYKSKLATAFLLLTVPVLINFVVAVISVAAGGIPVKYTELMQWLYSQLIYGYMSFSCVTLTAMVAGNLFSHMLLTGICTIIPLVVITFAEELCRNELFGYAGNMIDGLGYIYLIPTKGAMYSVKCLIYVAATAVFLFASYWIYKKRPLEKNGESSVFNITKILFIYFAAIVVGIFGYWYMRIWGEPSLLALIPFGVAAVIIANMINRRSITLKGAVVHSVIFTAGVLLVMLCFNSGFFGYESKIPEDKNIEGVKVNFNTYGSLIYYTRDGRAAYRKNTDECIIKDAEKIQKVTALHKAITENRRGAGYGKTVSIIYDLKNGGELKREYTINVNAFRKELEPVVSFEEVKKSAYPFYKRDDVKITEFEIYSRSKDRDSDNTVVIAKGGEHFDELREALDQDIEQLGFEDMTFLQNDENRNNVFIYIRFIEAFVDGNGNDIKESDVSTSFECLEINDGFKRTIGILDKCGLPDENPGASTINTDNSGEKVSE